MKKTLWQKNCCRWHRGCEVLTFLHKINFLSFPDTDLLLSSDNHISKLNYTFHHQFSCLCQLIFLKFFFSHWTIGFIHIVRLCLSYASKINVFQGSHTVEITNFLISQLVPECNSKQYFSIHFLLRFFVL